jgi:hypothetical protein
VEQTSDGDDLPGHATVVSVTPSWKIISLMCCSSKMVHPHTELVLSDNFLTCIFLGTRLGACTNFVAIGLTRYYAPSFFLWGRVKDNVYKTPVTSLNGLQLRIVAIGTPTPQMLGNTSRETVYHLEILRAMKGAHVEVLILEEIKLFELHFRIP